MSPLPTPWQFIDGSDSFIIIDRDGLEIARVYFDDRNPRLTRDEARKVASDIAKLPDLKAERKAELLTQGVVLGTLPEAKTVEAKPDLGGRGGARVTIDVEGTGWGLAGPVTQTWRARLNTMLASELQGKLGNVLGGKDKTLETDDE
jgi:hypothetical protein